jgi:hypothetical protein
MSADAAPGDDLSVVTLTFYRELAGFVVQETAEAYEVSLTDLDPEVEDLADHFANHVLWATITGRRREAGAAR